MLSRSRTRSRLRSIEFSRLVSAVLVLLALLLSGWALQRGFSFVRLGLAYAAPLDGQEGMALWEASLLRAGSPLYVPPAPDRFVSAPYPPVHPVILAALGGLRGPTVFFVGRVVSLAGAVAVALCGFGLVRKVTRSNLAGLASMCLILAFAPLQIWALRIKPDIIGLMWTVAGLWLVAIGAGAKEQLPRSGQTRAAAWRLPPALILAALAFVLAHFTKQTMLAGPLAGATYLWLVNRRLAVRWAGLYLALLLTTWLSLDLVTHGQYSYHIWTLHRLPWTGYRFWKLASQLRDMWPLLILGLAGLVASVRRPTVINAYLLWAPASLIGAGVTGSHHNHLLETGVALALAGAQAAGFGINRGGILRALAPAMIATQFLLWHTPLPWFVGDYAPEPKHDRYIDFIRATPGEILADDPSLVYAAGRPLRYDDPAAMGPAAAIGLWDASHFVAEIRAGRFSALLLPMDVWQDGVDDPRDRWTPEMLQAVRDAYTIKFKDSLIIYVPKAQATPQ